MINLRVFNELWQKKRWGREMINVLLVGKYPIFSIQLAENGTIEIYLQTHFIKAIN